MNGQVLNMVNGDTELKALSGWSGANSVTRTTAAMTSGDWTGTSYSTCLSCSCWPCRCHHTYLFPSPTFIEDRTKKAFALAKKLYKSKFMDVRKVGEFVELVELIELEL